MKSNCHPFIPRITACAVAILLVASANAQTVDCAAVAERVATAVKANPDEVLTIVEDAMVAYENCACEVVSAAIESSNGSADMVRQIVLVAVQTAETQAPTIAECAVAAAPQHAEAVRNAFAQAFNGKEAPAIAAAAAERTQVAVATDANTAGALEISADDQMLSLDGSDDLPSLSGKEVLRESLSDQARNELETPAPELAGAAPLSVGMAFLIPPVSASPIIEDEPEKVIIIKEKVVTRTRVVNRLVPRTVIRTVPRTVIRTVPVSPTTPHY